MLEDKLEQDIKTALLAGDSKKATILRGLKASLLNEKVAKGKRETGLSDDEVIACFSKEAKKRQESADLYKQGGSQERADAELAEKAIIEAYLPPKLSEEEVESIVDEVISANQLSGMQNMGQAISKVKERVGTQADGAFIAKLVKEKLS